MTSNPNLGSLSPEDDDAELLEQFEVILDYVFEAGIYESGATSDELYWEARLRRVRPGERGERTLEISGGTQYHPRITFDMKAAALQRGVWVSRAQTSELIFERAGPPLGASDNIIEWASNNMKKWRTAALSNPRTRMNNPIRLQYHVMYGEERRGVQPIWIVATSPDIEGRPYSGRTPDFSGAWEPTVAAALQGNLVRGRLAIDALEVRPECRATGVRRSLYEHALDITGSSPITSPLPRSRGGR